MNVRYKIWLSLLIVSIPMLVLGAVGLALVLSAPSEVPLWRNGAIENGGLAAGLGLLMVFAWALVRALSRLAEKLMD